MSFGFEPWGTNSELKGIMYHGLFHRDFPELWKLHSNQDLNEKVVYCLSLRQLCASTMNGGTVTAARFIDESNDWLEFPLFKQLLFESIRTSYRLLILTQVTKKQREVYAKLISVFHDVAKANGYSIAESVDDKLILKHLRVFFRSHFQLARKLLQTLKSVSDSEDQKHYLKSLIQDAEAVDFDNPSPELVYTTSKATVDAPSSSQNVTSAIPKTVVNDRDASFDDANAVVSAASISSSPTECEAQSTSTFSHSRSRKRRAESQVRKLQLSSSKKSRTGISLVSTRARRSVVSPGSQSIDFRAPEIAQGTRTTGKQHATTPNSERTIVEALPRPNVIGLLQAGQGPQRQQTQPRNGITEESLPFRLLDDTNGSVGQSQTSSQSALEVSLQACVIGRFPVSSLGMYLLNLPLLSVAEQASRESRLCEVLGICGLPVNSPVHHNLKSKQLFQCYENRAALRDEIAAWFGGVVGPSYAEIDAMHQIVHVGQRGFSLETMPDQIARLEAYITLLRTTVGNAWLHNTIGMDLDARIDYLFRQLVLCFMTDSFQHIILGSEDINATDRMIWGDFCKYCASIRNQMLITAANCPVRLASVPSCPSPVATNRNATTHAAIMANLSLLLTASPNTHIQARRVTNGFRTI